MTSRPERTLHLSEFPPFETFTNLRYKGCDNLRLTWDLLSGKMTKHSLLELDPLIEKVRSWFLGNGEPDLVSLLTTVSTLTR